MKYVILLTLMLPTLLFAQDVESPIFPSFSLPNLEGEHFTLDTLRGDGPVFITFWATWCKPCLQEMKELEKIYIKYKDRGFQVIAINNDGARRVKQLPRFISRQGFTFPVLWDDGSFKKRIGITDLPTNFLLDTEGRIVLRKRGYKKGDEIALEKMIAGFFE